MEKQNGAEAAASTHVSKFYADRLYNENMSDAVEKNSGHYIYYVKHTCTDLSRASRCRAEPLWSCDNMSFGNDHTSH